MATPAGTVPPPPLALVPAYNEAARVGSVVQGALHHLSVLVVDDGSQDGTADRAREAGAEVLALAPNRGKGGALKAGFAEALHRGVPAVVTLDGDGQHDPREIPAFVAAWRAQEVDLVLGERTLSDMPPFRRLANWLGRILFSWALGRTVRDNQSGYRLISRRLMEAMLASLEEGFELEVEMIVIAAQRSMGIASVPIRTIYGDETSHIRNRRHALEFLRMVRKTRRARKGSAH